MNKEYHLPFTKEWAHADSTVRKKIYACKALTPTRMPRVQFSLSPSPGSEKEKKNTNPIILKSLTLKSHHFEIPSLQNSIISKSLIQTTLTLAKWLNKLQSIIIVLQSSALDGKQARKNHDKDQWKKNFSFTISEYHIYITETNKQAMYETRTVYMNTLQLLSNID